MIIHKGFNMCYALQESSKKGFVQSAHRFKHSIEETVIAFIEQFGGTKDDAEATVKKYWNVGQDRKQSAAGAQPSQN